MITSEELSAAAGILLSLALSYLPGVSAWFADLSPQAKRLAMLGLLAAVTGAMVGLSCGGLAADLGLPITCDRAGLVHALRAFALAVIANQAAFLVAPKPARVRRAVLYTRFQK